MIMMIMRILMRRRLMVTEEEALTIQFEQRCGAPDGLREVCHMAVWEKVQIFFIYFFHLKRSRSNIISSSIFSST